MRLRRRQGEAPPGGVDWAEGELRLPTPLVTGWLLAERGYSRVELRVEGREPVRARLFSLDQPEVAEVFDQPSAALAGWTVSLDLSDLEAGGELQVTATAVGAAGELELGSARLLTTARPPVPPADPDWIGELAIRTSAAAAAHRSGPGLRLLAFTHSLDTGGGQLYLLELVRHLLEKPDAACTVIAPEDGPLRERLERAGAMVHLGGWPGHGADYECYLRELVLLARDAEANAVFANTSLAFDGVDLANRLGIPSIWAIHESLTIDQILYGAFLWTDDYVASRLRAALEMADAVVFEADATRRLFAAQATNPERLRRLDYGIELAELDASRRELDRDRLRGERGFGPQDRVILCPGTLEPRKAQAMLALVFARLAGEFPDAVLTMVGGTDSHPEYAQGTGRVIERLGLGANRIRVEPSTPRVHEWYGLADAVVVASDNESLPRVIIEAMAFGLPVLGTRVFGIPELIEDGVNGLLCEPQDLDALEEGLRRLLSLTEAEAARLGEAAEGTVRPERDAARYAETIRRTFDRLRAGSEVTSADPLG